MLKKAQSPNSDLFKDPPEGFQQSVWESKSRVSSSNTQQQSVWESRYPVSSSNTQVVPIQGMTIRAITTTAGGGQMVVIASPSQHQPKKKWVCLVVTVWIISLICTAGSEQLPVPMKVGLFVNNLFSPAGLFCVTTVWVTCGVCSLLIHRRSWRRLWWRLRGTWTLHSPSSSPSRTHSNQPTHHCKVAY